MHLLGLRYRNVYIEKGRCIKTLAARTAPDAINFNASVNATWGRKKTVSKL